MLILWKMVCIGCGAVWLAEEWNKLLKGVYRSEMFARIFLERLETEDKEGSRGLSSKVLCRYRLCHLIPSNPIISFLLYLEVSFSH